MIFEAGGRKKVSWPEFMAVQLKEGKKRVPTRKTPNTKLNWKIHNEKMPNGRKILVSPSATKIPSSSFFL